VLAVLGVFSYRGVRWSRGAIVAWLSFIALAFGVGSIFMMGKSIAGGLFSLALVAGLTYGAAVLYTSDDVEAFLDSRNRGPVRPSGPTI